MKTLEMLEMILEWAGQHPILFFFLLITIAEIITVPFKTYAKWRDM